MSPFKGCNIVDLGFLCQQIVERVRMILSFNVSILRFYLFYVTKNCFVLPRKDLKVRFYVHLIHLVWEPVRDAGYIHTHACLSVRYDLA